MTYFQNPIFMAAIIKSQGANQFFEIDQVAPMLTLLEMQTLLALEAAIKFMKKDRRVKLKVGDIQMAAREIGHQEMDLFPAPASKNVRNGKITIKNLLESCAFNLTNRIETSQLKGEWIFYKENVIESDSIQIRKLKKQDPDIMEKKKLENFNIISICQDDDQMTKEQVRYIKEMENQLMQNRKRFDGKIEGRVRRHFHLYLHLIRRYPNEVGLKMLANLCNHPEVDQSTVIYNIPKILEILMVYRGRQAYKAGEMIVELVKKCKEFQPQLLNILSEQKENYSYVIKAVVFESQFGIQTLKENLFYLLRKARRQSARGDGMASLCLRILLKNIETLAIFYKYKIDPPIELPNSYLYQDRYLSCY